MEAFNADTTDVYLSYLPLPHIFERMVQVGMDEVACADVGDLLVVRRGLRAGKHGVRCVRSGLREKDFCGGGHVR